MIDDRTVRPHHGFVTIRPESAFCNNNIAFAGPTERGDQRCPRRELEAIEPTYSSQRLLNTLRDIQLN